ARTLAEGARAHGEMRTPHGNNRAGHHDGVHQGSACAPHAVFRASRNTPGHPRRSENKLTPDVPREAHGTAREASALPRCTALRISGIPVIQDDGMDAVRTHFEN